MLLNYSVPLIWNNKHDIVPYEYVAIFQLEQKKQWKEILKCKSGLLGKSRNQSCLLRIARTWWCAHDNNHAQSLKLRGTYVRHVHKLSKPANSLVANHNLLVSNLYRNGLTSEISYDFPICNLTGNELTSEIIYDFPICNLIGNKMTSEISYDFPICNLTGNGLTSEISYDLLICNLIENELTLEAYGWLISGKSLIRQHLEKQTQKWIFCKSQTWLTNYKVFQLLMPK